MYIIPLHSMHVFACMEVKYTSNIGENIYTSILYYITNIRGELQLAIYGRASWQLHSRHNVAC